MNKISYQDYWKDEKIFESQFLKDQEGHQNIKNGRKVQSRSTQRGISFIKQNIRNVKSSQQQQRNLILTSDSINNAENDQKNIDQCEDISISTKSNQSKIFSQIDSEFYQENGIQYQKDTQNNQEKKPICSQTFLRNIIKQTKHQRKFNSQINNYLVLDKTYTDLRNKPENYSYQNKNKQQKMNKRVKSTSFTNFQEKNNNNNNKDEFIENMKNQQQFIDSSSIDYSPLNKSIYVKNDHYQLFNDQNSVQYQQNFNFGHQNKSFIQGGENELKSNNKENFLGEDEIISPLQNSVKKNTMNFSPSIHREMDFQKQNQIKKDWIQHKKENEIDFRKTVQKQSTSFFDYRKKQIKQQKSRIRQRSQKIENREEKIDIINMTDINLNEENGGDAAGYHVDKIQRVKNNKQYAKILGELGNYIKPKKKEISYLQKFCKADIQQVSKKYCFNKTDKKIDQHNQMMGKYKPQVMREFMNKKVKDLHAKQVEQKKKQNAQMAIQCFETPVCNGAIPKYKKFKKDFFDINNRNLQRLGPNSHAKYQENYLTPQYQILVQNKSFNSQDVDPFNSQNQDEFLFATQLGGDVQKIQGEQEIQNKNNQETENSQS